MQATFIEVIISQLTICSLTNTTKTYGTNFLEKMKGSKYVIIFLN